jgi:hypothetical protein
VTELPDEIFQAPDQHLRVLDMHAYTINEEPDPPQVLLMLTVQHEETGNQWLQQAELNRVQLQSLTSLLMHICRNNNVEVG